MTGEDTRDQHLNTMLDNVGKNFDGNAKHSVITAKRCRSGIIITASRQAASIKNVGTIHHGRRDLNKIVS